MPGARKLSLNTSKFVYEVLNNIRFGTLSIQNIQDHPVIYLPLGDLSIAVNATSKPKIKFKETSEPAINFQSKYLPEIRHISLISFISNNAKGVSIREDPETFLQIISKKNDINLDTLKSRAMLYTASELLNIENTQMVIYRSKDCSDEHLPFKFNAFFDENLCDSTEDKTDHRYITKLEEFKGFFNSDDLNHFLFSVNFTAVSDELVAGSIKNFSQEIKIAQKLFNENNTTAYLTELIKTELGEKTIDFINLTSPTK